MSCLTVHLKPAESNFTRSDWSYVNFDEPSVIPRPQSHYANLLFPVPITLRGAKNKKLYLHPVREQKPQQVGRSPFLLEWAPSGHVSPPPALHWTDSTENNMSAIYKQHAQHGHDCCPDTNSDLFTNETGNVSPRLLNSMFTKRTHSTHVKPQTRHMFQWHIHVQNKFNIHLRRYLPECPASSSAHSSRCPDGQITKTTITQWNNKHTQIDDKTQKQHNSVTIKS